MRQFLLKLMQSKVFFLTKTNIAWCEKQKCIVKGTFCLHFLEFINFFSYFCGKINKF